MAERRKLPLQIREAEVRSLETRKEGKATRISFALSSELPVERVFGMEILDHNEKSIRMGRLSRRAMPLLFNHNADDPIGMVESGELQEGRLVVEATMFETERAREVEAMLAGGLRNVSVGYRIYDAEEDPRLGQVRVTDWEPYEASIVTIPADPTVGLGRSDEQVFEVEIRSINPAISAEHQEDDTMSEQLNASAGVSADVRNDSASFERLRIQTIHKLCDQHKIPQEQREAWVAEGADVDQVSRSLLDVIAERGTRNQGASVSAIGMTDKETKDYSMFRAIRAVLDKNWSKAGLEFEAHREIAKRTNSVINENTFYVPLEVQRRSIPQKRAADLSVAAAGGGYLVETTNQGFIEMLRNRSVAFQLGATRLSGLVGNVNIPKQSAAATAYWLAAETTQVTDTVQTILQVPLTPKTVGAYTEISRLLLLQSSPDAEGIVMSDLAQVTALAVDKAALHGAGGSGEPAGIVGASGVTGVTATTIGTGTYGKMLDFQLGLASANALFGNLGYVTTPTVAKLLTAYSRFANTDTPIWNGNLLNATVAGLPAITSNQVEAGYMIFGNWADLIIGEWGILSVEANPYANFQAGIVGVRAMYTVDIALRRGQSFSVSASVAA
jgi:HK97 family phage major capsid protein/HK97 family phage prohead protease